MANPTTNFGWVMPTSTSLVTNLPADFNTFGQAVDTSMAQLKGGTTGQILSKTSATDMAFTWITNDVGDITAVTAGTGISGGGTTGAVTITNDMATTITTNGDLIYGTGSGTYTRRAIGSTGNVLTVSGGVPVWAAPSGGTSKIGQVVNATYSTTYTNTTTTYGDTGLTATITPTASNSKILVLINQPMSTYKASSVNSGLFWRLLRGATDLTLTGANESLYIGGASGNQNLVNLGFSIIYLDSPATTSATTYKSQAKASVSGYEATAQGGNGTASITLMEVLA